MSKESLPGKINRRNFLKRSALAAGGALTTIPVAKKLSSVYEEHKDKKFNKDVEREKSEVVNDIQRGLEGQVQSEAAREEHNKLVEQLDQMDPKTAEYKKTEARIDALFVKYKYLTVRAGNQSVGLLPEANQYAAALAKNPDAILALATARVLYRDKVDGVPGFASSALRYWHNLAKAYLELSHYSSAQIEFKMQELFKYAEDNHIEVANISFLNITYCLIDENFDFSLKAEDLEAELDKISSKWKDRLPTHSNKNSYAHFNDLKTLNIFEMNRLKSVLAQLRDPEFVKSVFVARNFDLSEKLGEFGGVIPRPKQSNQVKVIPSRLNLFGNESRSVSNEDIIEGLSSAALFHFHATKKEEGPEHEGPSSGDISFFAPEVVFTSKDEFAISVHFSVGRANMAPFNAFAIKTGQDVVFLGEIRK